MGFAVDPLDELDKKIEILQKEYDELQALHNDKRANGAGLDDEVKKIILTKCEVMELLCDLTLERRNLKDKIEQEEEEALKAEIVVLYRAECAENRAILERLNAAKGTPEEAQLLAQYKEGAARIQEAHELLSQHPGHGIEL